MLRFVKTRLLLARRYRKVGSLFHIVTDLTVIILQSHTIINKFCFIIETNEAAQVGREAGQQVKGQAQKFGQGIKQTAYDRTTQPQEHSKGMLDKMKDTISDAADMVQGKSKGQMENVKETYSSGN